MAKRKEVIFKVVISHPKSGKSIQKELKGDDVKKLIGKKIGDIIDGDIFGLEGYKLKITGGSDFAGIPMRKEIEGTLKKRIWWRVNKKVRIKKLVCGNTIYERTSQINTIVVEEGPTSFEEIYNNLKAQTQEATN